MSNYVLDLSTQVKPSKKFLVDGSEYEILTDQHLSPAQEAHVVALFARHGVLSSQLDVTSNVPAGERLAGQIRSTQIQIFSMLTTMPKDVAEKLSATQAVKMFLALQAEQEGDEDETSESDDGGDGDDA